MTQSTLAELDAKRAPMVGEDSVHCELGRRNVKGVGRTDAVAINQHGEVHAAVHYVVDVHHQAWLDFLLDSQVDLQAVRRPIIGIEDADTTENAQVGIELRSAPGGGQFAANCPLAD